MSMQLNVTEIKRRLGSLIDKGEKNKWNIIIITMK
jgi:hypothetical protein